MGLIDSASAENKQLISGLVVTYSKTRIHQPYTYLSQVNVLTTIEEVWEYHRYATKTYSYVGMSYAGAKTKAKSLIDNYTRSYYQSEWNSGGQNAGEFTNLWCGDKLQADISVVKDVGHMYKVVVKINEDDTKLDISGTRMFEFLFAYENLRGYDY